MLKYCNPSENENGSWTYSIPACGANGIDLSYFVNSAEGTGKSCSLVLGEGLDARGLTPLVFDDDIGMMSVGDELLADYPPAIEGIDCNKGMAEIIKAAFLDFSRQ